NRGQLNLDGFEFWQPTSQLLALDVQGNRMKVVDI
ncbi:DUF645 family protein, partial [Vibrio cholerae]